MADRGKGVPHFLHCHSGFDLGGKEARAVRLMNHWGKRVQHTLLSAMPQAMGARAMIHAAVSCQFPQDDPATSAPSLQGWPEPRRYWKLARYMQQFDLVLSYNWGSMDAVMAHRMFSPFLRLPPLIHHEDGFNEDEAERLKPKRNRFRQIGLTSAHALVVPSERLRTIAGDVWHQPERRVRLISNGIDIAAYAQTPRTDAIPGFVRDPKKLVVGTLAGLRAVKNLPRLVRAVAPIADRVQLVIVGEGPDRHAICEQAKASGVTDIHLPGFMTDPWRFVGLFDIFALSSDSEQSPISLVEAMAAGVPAVTTDVGDVLAMVSEANRPFIVSGEDETTRTQRMTEALTALLDDADLRAAVGAANRERARTHFAEDIMLASYENLYAEAMKMAY
jgi:L-malate glycosyltransferase